MAEARNRKYVRQALGDLLEAQLSGSGKPAQAVYRYLKGNFKGQSPVICLASRGSIRTGQGWSGGKYYNRFGLDILIFVADADPNNSWTEEMVDDAVDDLEQAVANVIAENRITNEWALIEHEPDTISDIKPAIVAGQPYVLERIPVFVQAHDN